MNSEQNEPIKLPELLLEIKVGDDWLISNNGITGDEFEMTRRDELPIQAETADIKAALAELVEAINNGFDQMDTDCRACTDGLTIVEVALVKAQKILDV